MTNKGIIYYTDNRLDSSIMARCQGQLKSIGLPIVSVSLCPMDFGRNIVLPLQRGYLTMFKQIMTALENAESDVVYFCEHDVLYHPNHFEFSPSRDDTYYYNRNNWKLGWSSGQALFYNCEQTLGLCGNRLLLLEHYQKRVARVEREGFSRKMGFEPGKHTPPNGIDANPWDWWMSEYPNVDIRHDYNLTETRWSQTQFRSQRNCTGWVMSESIPYWGTIEEIKNGRVEKNS